MNPQFENPICQTIEMDLTLPAKWRFGLKQYERATLFFPGFPAQPQLWRQLKRPESIKQLQQTGEDIYAWLSESVPGIHGSPQFRDALCGHPAELFHARRLWNFPRTDRPSSDEKRIAFFAESLAGFDAGNISCDRNEKTCAVDAPETLAS